VRSSPPSSASSSVRLLVADRNGLRFMPARSFAGQTYTSLWSESEASRSPVWFSRAMGADREPKLAGRAAFVRKRAGPAVRIHLAPPRVSGLEHSPGMSAKSPRVGVMCPPHRHRRELRSRVMPRHVDFLSVGEEFGADACNLARATQGGNLRISSSGRTSQSRENQRRDV
jgi:hypothetical protein